MSVAVDAARIAVFEEIFQQPSIERMMQMDPSEFEAFIGYVFSCAGYRVEYVGDQHFPKGPGVDLELYTTQTGQRPVARVEVKRYSAALDFHDVMAFNGVLGINAPGIGYFVTTGRFTDHAQAGANQAAKVRLIDGAGLMRYITYLSSSRVPDADGVLRTAVPTPPDWLALPATTALCDPRHTTILSLANNKGGVAKTTSALNLAFTLAQRGLKVLLIDLDGQASLTAALPLPLSEPKQTKNAPLPKHKNFVSEFFANPASDLRYLVQRTRFSNLWLIPANEQLHRMDTGGVARTESELRFVRAVQDMADTFDWIIIDTPPAQSFYTRAALAASHYVLVPVNVEAFAVRGIRRVLDTAQAMNALSGGAQVLGYVVTRWKSSSTANKEIHGLTDELAAVGLRQLSDHIPAEDNIEKAHLTTMAGGIKGLLNIGSSKAALRYRDLLDKLIQEARPYVHEPS